MYSRKQGIQPGPSINLCPKCHSHKEPNQSTCSVCNTRACPNGHILGATERICSRCNWVDRQMKPASTLYSTAKTGAKAEENLPQNICPICHNRISSSASKCAYCGNLVRPDFDQIEPGSGLKSPPASGAPLHAESIIVQQETIGHHDKKRTYLCPNCRNRVDDPSSGKCPYCGYVGAMQYDITRKQPAWTAPPSPPPLSVPPPRQKVSAGEPPRYVPPEGVMAPPSQTQPPLYEPLEHAAVPPGQRESSCPSCGAPNPTDSRFCRTCGHRYGTGRTSKKILAESTAERSYRSATAPSEFFAPITASQAEAMEMDAEEMPARRRGKTITAPQKGKALPREKKAGRSKQRPADAERKFPLVLLMSIMVVAALIVALAIFVISRESRSPEPPSGQPPVITEHTFNTAVDGSLIVNWTTDKPSTSQVMFCDPDGLCSWTELDTTLVRSHSVTVSSLEAGVTYHITLESVDVDGNKGQFEAERTFSTSGSTDTTPPAISQLEASSITDSGFTITWQTDEPATSQVKYGTSQSMTSSTSLNSTLTTNHSVTLTGLSPTSEYYVKAISQDAAGNSGELSRPQPVTTQAAIPTGLNVGNRAPDFTLSSVNGSSVSLSSLRGKIVMLNFWAIWCLPCVAEMPHMQTIQSTWAGNPDLEIVGVNVQESLSVVEPYVQTQGYTFTVLLDPGNLKALYNVVNFPTTYFIDSQGIIRQVKVGSFDTAAQITDILSTLN